jgi:hypothetical protein
MWTVFPRRTQRPISISRTDIKTPKTKLEAERKPLTAQTKAVQNIGTATTNRADLDSSY